MAQRQQKNLKQCGTDLTFYETEKVHVTEMNFVSAINYYYYIQHLMLVRYFSRWEDQKPQQRVTQRDPPVRSDSSPHSRDPAWTLGETNAPAQAGAERWWAADRNPVTVAAG